MPKKLRRRSFIHNTAICAAAVATVSNASSYVRIKGANDRINVGFLGCGARSAGHRNMVEMSWKEKPKVSWRCARSGR